jgi:phenylalanyl-tRNA synthetase beta chain
MQFIQIVREKNNMLISRNWLQDHFEKTLPNAQEIAETLMLHSFEIEHIYNTDYDQVIDIDVLPNRAHDCLCYAGIAREYSVLTGYVLRKERYQYNDSVVFNENSKNITLENNNQCLRYMTRYISNINIHDSPVWLQERMKSMGQRSINNIVDATNYVMFDIGNPMHVFDADKIIGNITIRNARQNETMTILGGELLDLELEDLVIADDEGVLALAGVKGGSKAEVTKSTKNIILEVANFNPTTTRSTSRRLKILTDSSKRFENEISSETAEIAMEAISRLTSDIANPESLGEIIDRYPYPQKEYVITIDHHHINRLLGTSLEEFQIKEILSRIDYQFRVENATFFLTIPSNRLDLRIPEDIIEEIGRIYGYHNIPTKGLEKYSFIPRVHTYVFTENKLKAILLNKGFNELKNYVFNKTGDIELENPLSSDKAALRKNLFQEMAISVNRNLAHIDYFGLDRIALFEIGRVYTEKGELDICCISVANKDKKAFKKYGNPQKQLASVIALINNRFNSNVKCSYTGDLVSFDISECYGKNESYDGVLNEISYEENTLFHSISVFPYVTRDISFWAPATTSDEYLKKLILDIKTVYLKKIFLFDRFEKEGRISYAFSLVFQSKNKTLTDDEVFFDMVRIEKTLMQNDCELR